MQPLTKPVQYNTCDVGVLPTERIADFRAYLNDHGCETRDGKGGQHFHAMTPDGWATLSRAKKGQVGSPHWMTPIIRGFLLCATTSMAPEHWEKLGITVEGMRQRRQARHQEKSRGSQGTVAMDLASGPDTTVEMTAAIQGDKLVVNGIKQISPAPSSRVPRQAGDFQVLPFSPQGRIHTGKQDPAAEFLEDLRDDFAVYCPLGKKPDESMDDFARRRWEYATAMVNARPASLA